ncbi:DUF1542 domain-containing protein, partial [Enterococcus hirae]|uniref:DUF1542 domain-containing protein n=1 Tax=Enterococcus hirae TaxID=1354 RepID=UPI001378EB51
MNVSKRKSLCLFQILMGMLFGFMSAGWFETIVQADEWPVPTIEEGTTTDSMNLKVQIHQALPIQEQGKNLDPLVFTVDLGVYTEELTEQNVQFKLTDHQTGTDLSDFLSFPIVKQGTDQSSTLQFHLSSEQLNSIIQKVGQVGQLDLELTVPLNVTDEKLMTVYNATTQQFDLPVSVENSAGKTETVVKVAAPIPTGSVVPQAATVEERGLTIDDVEVYIDSISGLAPGSSTVRVHIPGSKGAITDIIIQGVVGRNLKWSRNGVKDWRLTYMGDDYYEFPIVRDGVFYEFLNNPRNVGKWISIYPIFASLWGGEYSRPVDSKDTYLKKEEAKKEIDQVAQKVKEEIDNDFSLSSDEKTKQKKGVDSEADKAKVEIDNANSNDEIEQAKEIGIEKIKEQHQPNKLNLQNLKITGKTNAKTMNLQATVQQVIPRQYLSSYYEDVLLTIDLGKYIDKDTIDKSKLILTNKEVTNIISINSYKLDIVALSNGNTGILLNLTAEQIQDLITHYNNQSLDLQFSIDVPLNTNDEQIMDAYDKDTQQFQFPISVDNVINHSDSTAHVTMQKPTGEGVTQTSSMGLSTDDLNPADCVTNLHSVLGFDKVKVIGFKEKVEFNTTGVRKPIVLVESEKTGVQGEVVVTINVLNEPVLAISVPKEVKLENKGLEAIGTGEISCTGIKENTKINVTVPEPVKIKYDDNEVSLHVYNEKDDYVRSGDSLTELSSQSNKKKFTLKT